MISLNNIEKNLNNRLKSITEVFICNNFSFLQEIFTLSPHKQVFNEEHKDITENHSREVLHFLASKFMKFLFF